MSEVACSRSRPYSEANPGRLRPKERSQPHDNPDAVRQRDSREFGPETGRWRATSVNRSSRARGRVRDSHCRQNVANPCRIQRINCPVSPPAQSKTPRSLNFATVGFKLGKPVSNLGPACYRLDASQDAGFHPTASRPSGRKPCFEPTRFIPVFARFLSQDTMGVYPVTLSLLARLSLFGSDLGWGASCDDRDRANGKALITLDTWGKKERLASWC